MRKTECMKQFLTEINEKDIHSINFDPEFKYNGISNYYWEVLKDTLREYGYVIKKRQDKIST